MRRASGTLVELRLLRWLDAHQNGYPVEPVTVAGNVVRDGDSGQTRWRSPLRRLADGTHRYEVEDELLERIAAATPTQIRSFLNNRGVSLTLAQATRIRDIAVAAVDDGDDGDEVD